MPLNRNQNEEQLIQGLPLSVEIKMRHPGRGVLATANVKIGEIMTVRNVKIKYDDYGPVVVIPRTKIESTGLYRDSVFFADRQMKENFDTAVLDAYHRLVQEMENAQRPYRMEEEEEGESITYDEEDEVPEEGFCQELEM